MVAGTLFKFDLVLMHKNEEADGCSRTGGEEERCHVEVYDVPWEQRREISSTTCDRN